MNRLIGKNKACVDDMAWQCSRSRERIFSQKADCLKKKRKGGWLGLVDHKSLG